MVKVNSRIEVIPAVTLAMVREETLPVVRFVGDASVQCLASDEIHIEFRLETPDGLPITDRNAEVHLESTAGYLVSRRVKTTDGLGSTMFRPDGMRPGEVAKIKAGFKLFSGTHDLMVRIV